MSNLLPGIFSSRDIRFAVQRDVRERISIQELDSPFKETNQTPKDTEENCADQVAISGSRSLSGRTYLSKELDDGNEQAS